MKSSVARLLLALACINVALVMGQDVSQVEAQLLWRSKLGTACVRNDQCGANQFCLPAALSSMSGGACAQCWRCCLFPHMYGKCPDRCNCNIGSICETRENCGNGLFCSVADPWEMPTCQRCNNCTSNAFEVQGSCVIACPSADMSGLADLPNLAPEHYLFLSFLAHDISQQGAYSPAVLLKSELSSWVQGQGFNGSLTELAVSRMLAGDPEAVDTKSWMEVVSETSSTSFMCPAYDPNQSWNQQPALTIKGCFCNATANARTFRCPAGTRCSPASFVGLETDAPRDPTATIFRAICVACEQGQFCPEGTYLKDETQLDALICPEGNYCPTPAVKRECPPGTFCTGRQTAPVTCDMQDLLLNDPNKELSMKPDTVIDRVRDKRDPLRGNYCPVGSTRPNDVCSAGKYCPNASTVFECPRGYYCKAQSTAPWKCPLLTRCPPGTTVPPLSFMALVVAAIVIGTIPLLHLAFTHLDNSIIMDADEMSDKRAAHRAAVASRMTFRLLKSIKVDHPSALENKYRGFRTVSPPITMEFESLGLRIRPRGGEVRNVLNGVSGSFTPRRLNAILGPSGCGKTTFLNVLCGKISNGTIMGQVRVNGDDVPIDRLKKIMGFVPQDDIVHEDLTVRENLNYSARLRLPSDMTRARRRDIVHDALEMLGLSAIQHYRVGTVERRGISGGQRKRVNIGLELVAMPSLLFLDEPTSGLDATSSADILNSLVDMANLGMNIIMVIHQPRFSSFLMFDQVLLLGGGGHTVYLGSPSAAMLYFTKYLGYRFPDCENPSDILMDIIAGKLPCTGDHRLKTCAQLVEKWTMGGMAWVETLETLNPTMVTKMSEVDPAIILAIDEEFDSLDTEGTGQINATQLVQLFGALKQDISVEDAVILIRKINAHRPASAKAAARSGASTPLTPRTPAGDADGLTVTKQQLLDAFQGVREANDEGNADGAVQRNAAAKFYASHFLLPDLPEVKNYRAAMERRRRKPQREGGNPRSSRPSGDRPSASGYDSPGRRSGRSTPGGYSNVDSDSYSQLGQDGGDGAGTPVVESIMRRSILAPAGGGRRGVSGVSSSGAGGNRTVRSVALLPGLTNDSSASSNTTRKAASFGSGEAAAAAAAADGAGSAASGGADSDAGATGDLSAFAVRQHYAAAATSEVKPQRGGDGGDEYDDEEYDSEDEIGLGDAQLTLYNSQCVAVSCGVVADSLAAMEALAHADVPLPQLPRRVERSTEYGQGREKRHSKTFQNIQSYVQAYNELATEPLPSHKSVAGSVGGMLRGVQQMSLTRSGAFGGGSTSVAAAAAAASARRRSSMAPAAPRGGRRPPRLRIDSPSGGVSVRPARLSRADEEEEEEEEEESDRPTTDNPAALPPLLRALLSGPAAGPKPTATLQPGPKSAPVEAGPVAEGLEDGDGYDPAALAAQPRRPQSRGAEGQQMHPDADADAEADRESVQTPPGLQQQQSQAESEPSRDSINDAMPVAPPVAPPAAPLFAPTPPKRPSAGAGDGRQWRRFGGSLPRGGAAAGPAGAPQPSSGDPGSGDRASHGRSRQPSRFGFNRSPTGDDDSGDGGSGGGAAAGTASEGQQPASEYDDRTAYATDPEYEQGNYGGDDADGGDVDNEDVDGAVAAAAAAIDGGVNSRDLLARTRLMSDNSARNSAPLPRIPLGRQASNSASPTIGGSGGGGKQRRSSLGPSSSSGRKQRRTSWMQNSEGGGEPPTPGGSRSKRKDTLYVNSLLSNALVGAWAATQTSSVTGRNTSSLARTPRTTPGGGGAAAAAGLAAAVSGGGSPDGGSPSSAAAAAALGLNTSLPGGARSAGVTRAMANASGPIKLDSRVSAGSNNVPGGALNNALANKIDLEEALATRKEQRFTKQLLFLLRRGLIKYVRSFWPMRVMDTLLQLAAAFIIGLVHGTKWGITAVPGNSVMCMVCLGVLSCVTHLRTFSNNRVLLWRESASGMSILAYFLSQNLIDQIWVFAAPGLSLGVYYYLTLPRMPFSEFYVVGLVVCWWASGMAYLVSALLPPQNVLMAGVFISLIFGAFLNGLTYSVASARSTFMEGVMGLGYNRWAMEIITINELRNYQINHRNTIIMMAKGIGLCQVDVKLIDDGQPGISAEEALSYMALQSGFNMDSYCEESKSIAYVALFVLGLGFRLLAYGIMSYSCVKRH